MKEDNRMEAFLILGFVAIVGFGLIKNRRAQVTKNFFQKLFANLLTNC